MRARLRPYNSAVAVYNNLIMYPHRIRLRDPWECQTTAEGGRCFRRRFGYPGRIDAHERVWLTFAGTNTRAVVRLNDRLLDSHEDTPEGFECEVTALLRLRNELVVEVEGAADRGEVALEVRCTAFLRDVRRFAVWHDEYVELHVSGEVVGEAERPLELYVVLERSTAAYQTVTVEADGQPFEIVVADLPAEMWQDAEGPLVQVDLVNGAVVWYTSTARAPFEKKSG